MLAKEEVMRQRVMTKMRIEGRMDARGLNADNLTVSPQLTILRGAASSTAFCAPFHLRPCLRRWDHCSPATPVRAASLFGDGLRCLILHLIICF